MELYLEPEWILRPKKRKPHPLKGKHQWITDDPKKREKMMAGLQKGWHLPRKGKKTGRIATTRIPVSVYDLDGKYITTCLCVSEAAEKYGNGYAGNVHGCINGLRDRVGQYQFRRAKVVEFMGEKLVKKSPIEPYKRKRRKPNLITN